MSNNNNVQDAMTDVELGDHSSTASTSTNAQVLLQQAAAKQKKRFARFVFQLLMIEILYSYYLDFHLAFLILRALQLFSFSKSNRLMGALVVLSNVPIFISHILFPQQGALFIQFLHIQEEPFTILTYVLLLLTDVLILIFQCIYLFLKHDRRHARTTITSDEQV